MAYDVVQKNCWNTVGFELHLHMQENRSYGLFSKGMQNTRNCHDTMELEWTNY